MTDHSCPWSGAAAAIAARREREQTDELVARQLQAQCDEEADREAADAAAISRSAASAPSDDEEDEEDDGRITSGISCSPSPPAAAAAPSSSASSADAARSHRESALRRIANDGAAPTSGSGSGGQSGQRRATLGLDPSAGDELAFYLTRVAGQQNRCALSLGVILSGDVQRAILINYMIDVPWMIEFFPQLLTWPRVDMVKGHERGTPMAATRNPRFANVMHYNAPLPVMHGVHHSKMVILLYATGCRVAVCTANFISIDWLWKNNASFVQDFPRKNQHSPRGSDFETALFDYVEPYRSRGGLDVAALREFDFSAAKAVLIPSVPGFHTGAAMHRYGHMRLRAVLAREPLAPKFAQAPIVAQFSSLGSISEKWLADELRVSMAAHAPPRGGAAAAAGTTNASAALMANASLPPLRIVWPTVESVRTSLEGWSAGGSLCCDTKNMKPMLQRYLHVWDGEGQRRHRAMPHIKSYLRAAPDGELAWCLITSANLSNAAWGQLQKGNTQLMIRHYEVSQQMGVLFTPTHYARALQLLKSRNQENFTCTPHNPLVYSPKGDLSSLPYFTSRDAHQNQRHASAAGSHSAAAAAASSAAAAASSAASAAPALPAPPVVRFFLLPPMDASAGSAPASGAAGSSAAAAGAVAGKRKVEDLTGDDEEEEDGGGGSESVAASAAKRARLQGAPSTPASSAVSTQPIRPSPASSAASTGAAAASAGSAAAASPPVEHVVICPIPYNVQSRPYNFAKDKPWVWDQDFLFADCHGNVHLSVRS